MSAKVSEVSIELNGEPRKVPEGTTVAGLLESLGLAASKVAVERNRTIEARSRYATAQLGEGDRLEIVRFVGGG
jgi:thiamine biosynthesis protein ThiS